MSPGSRSQTSSLRNGGVGGTKAGCLSHPADSLLLEQPEPQRQGPFGNERAGQRAHPECEGPAFDPGGRRPGLC